MELKGQLVTLYPLSLEGAVVPRPINPAAAVAAFQNALLGQLTAAGLDVRMPSPGMPDMPIVIRAQLVLADPGSRLMRYFFTWFAGAAKFQASGALGTPQGPFGQVKGSGVRRAGIGGGDSEEMLADAAKLAGAEMGRQIVIVLEAR